MSALFRDSTAGQLVRLVFGRQVLTYAEEKAGSLLLLQYYPTSNPSIEPGRSSTQSIPRKPLPKERNAAEKAENLVDWYGQADPDNPKNWTLGKKSFVFLQICLMTLVVCASSSVVAPAGPIYEATFDISAQLASLSLSMYVFGYGIGPLIFSPMSEVPRFGRNIPYVASFFLFVVITVPAALVDNFPGFIVLRFLQGFCAGPVLATGGASASDLFAFHKVPYGLNFWTFAAFSGPAIGPVMSGFAVSHDWRWPMYQILIMGGFLFLVIFFCLPETNAETILLRRARRLRILTGNSKLQSQSEIKQGNLQVSEVLGKYLKTPFAITAMDPSVAFINFYMALVFAIFYAYFEAFPLVYTNVYGFSLGEMGAMFAFLMAGCLVGSSIYAFLLWTIYEPYTVKNGIGVQEFRLVPGIFAAVLAPAGLFMFAWTARPDIHWIVPTIGVVIYVASQFLLGGAIFIYLATSYPRFGASLFAANAFMRNSLAAAAVHFSQPLFENMGVAKGCSILGGCAAGCFFGIMALWYYGPSLRSRSKFAGVPGL